MFWKSNMANLLIEIQSRHGSTVWWSLTFSWTSMAFAWQDGVRWVSWQRLYMHENIGLVWPQVFFTFWPYISLFVCEVYSLFCFRHISSPLNVVWCNERNLKALCVHCQSKSGLQLPNAICWPNAGASHNVIWDSSCHTSLGLWEAVRCVWNSIRGNFSFTMETCSTFADALPTMTHSRCVGDWGTEIDWWLPENK